jgi:capsular polysaccharide biosynthesis protein cpsC
MENKEDIIDIDPMLILKRVTKYIWIIITIGVIFSIAAYIWSTIMVVPKYKSSTKVYVLNNNINEKKLTTQDFQIGNYLLKDYKEIILSSKVLERVIDKNGIKMNLVELRSKIEVKIPQDTRILTITVEDTDAKRAADIANAVRDEAFEEIKEITKEESVNILEKAQESKSPSSPDIRKNTIMAGAIGILLSLGIVVLKEVLDDRVKKQEDIEEGLRNGSFRYSSTNKNNKKGG